MMRRVLTVSAVALAAAAAAIACRERGRPDPNIRMAVSHEPAAVAEEGSGAAAAGGPAPSVPTKLEVPSAVSKAYSGIRLHWKDSGSGREGSLDVPLGSAVPIPGSTLQVRADVFLPAFTMTSDVITSSGVEPENPAARIAVADQGAEVFAGWIFTRFPDVHPFQHPRISLRLEGGVRRAS
jgi:hypothetical protein